jgi:hypothetical protein
VTEILAGQRVLQFQRRHGQAVDEQPHVDRVLVLRAIAKLIDDAEDRR